MALVKKDTYELTEGIISMIEIGVRIGTSLLLPNQTILKKEKWDNAKKRGTLRQAIKRLENQKLIAWAEIDGETRLTLTDKGKKRVLKYKIDDLKITKTPVWDGLFHVVIFDIPENKKGAREMLRRKLKDLEMQQLQKSVFVSPYDCRNEIDFLKNYYDVAKHVSYILAREIPDITFDIPREK